MKRALFALAFGLGVALCVACGVRDRPLAADTQLYFYIGERVASGVAPHVSLIDIKTTLGPIASGMAMKVGRIFDVPDVYSARYFSIAMAGLAVALVFAVVLELTGTVLAAGVAAGAMMTTYGFFLEAVTGSSPKVIMVPLLLASYLFTAQRRWILSGMVGVGAFFVWQPGIVVLGGAWLAVLFDRHSRWSDVGRLVLGMALALVAYESYFVWHGAVAEQIHQEFVLASANEPREFKLRESLWFFLTESRGYQTKPNTFPTLFFAIGAAALLYGIGRPRRGWETLRSRPGLVAFWSSAVVGTMFTLLDHQAHPDMMLVQPAFAVAAGLGFAALASLLGRLPAGRWFAAAAAVWACWYCFNDAQRLVRMAAIRPPGLSTQLELADLLGVYRDHRGSVWVVGAVHVLGFERAANHVPHAYLAGPIKNEFDFSTYRPLRDGKMPEILVVSRGIIPGQKEWLKAEYQEITPAAFAAQRMRVFGRRQPGFVEPKPIAFAKNNPPAKPAKPSSKPAAAPAKPAPLTPGAARPAPDKAPAAAPIGNPADMPAGN